MKSFRIITASIAALVASVTVSQAAELYVCKDLPYSDLKELYVVKTGNHLQAFATSTSNEPLSVSDDPVSNSAPLPSWNGYQRTIVQNADGGFMIEAKDECTSSYTYLNCVAK